MDRQLLIEVRLRCLEAASRLPMARDEILEGQRIGIVYDDAADLVANAEVLFNWVTRSDKPTSAPEDGLQF